MGVALITQHQLDHIDEAVAVVAHTVSGAKKRLLSDGVVLVTDRLPDDLLYHKLKGVLSVGKLDSLRVIGDAEAPHIIAQAVYSGYQAGREFAEARGDGTPFRIEYTDLRV
jgi:dimethylamine/trimethylamine dehydrogenase